MDCLRIADGLFFDWMLIAFGLYADCAGCALVAFGLVAFDCLHAGCVLVAFVLQCDWAAFVLHFDCRLVVFGLDCVWVVC